MDIIMLKKLILISLALGLTACANTEQTDANIAALTNKVNMLSAQVSELEEKQKQANMAAEQAASDAKAANERIDNVVASYKK